MIHKISVSKKHKKLKIIFLCGSLEEGHDGVGDYTVNLAQALVDEQHNITIIAINDGFVSTSLYANKNSINLIRLPETLNNIDKIQILKKHIKIINPDYLSLQFVPFAYHKKGLPFILMFQLAKLKFDKWHIMFHELWVGMERNDSLKLKIWGKLQYLLIKSLLYTLNPISIHSSNSLYIYHLNRILKTHNNINILPLFSNIKKVTSPRLNTEKSELKIILFAGIHANAPYKEFITWVIKETSLNNLKPKLIFIGKNGPHLKQWKESLFTKKINFEILGMKDENTVSNLLSESDIGITTTPYYLCGKSGSVAAMLEHGLPTLCVSKQWIPKVNVDLDKFDPENICQWNESLSLNLILKTEIKFHTTSSISKRFLKDL